MPSAPLHFCELQKLQYAKMSLHCIGSAHLCVCITQKWLKESHPIEASSLATLHILFSSVQEQVQGVGEEAPIWTYYASSQKSQKYVISLWGWGGGSNRGYNGTTQNTHQGWWQVHALLWMQPAPLPNAPWQRDFRVSARKEKKEAACKQGRPDLGVLANLQSEVLLLPPEFLSDCIQLPLQLVVHVHLLFQLPLKFLLGSLQPVYFFLSFFYLAFHCFQAQAQLQNKHGGQSELKR